MKSMNNTDNTSRITSVSDSKSGSITQDSPLIQSSLRSSDPFPLPHYEKLRKERGKGSEQ